MSRRTRARNLLFQLRRICKAGGPVTREHMVFTLVRHYDPDLAAELTTVWALSGENAMVEHAARAAGALAAAIEDDQSTYGPHYTRRVS